VSAAKVTLGRWIRRPGQSDPWAEVILRRVQGILARISQLAGVDVKEYLAIIGLAQRRVVLDPYNERPRSQLSWIAARLSSAFAYDQDSGHNRG
jgi:hypothetical protein